MSVSYSTRENGVIPQSCVWYLPSVVSFGWPTPGYAMNTVSSFPLKPGDPAEWHATEELVENQGSEPGNRLVKEPATTASSMGYKQHWIDLKQSAGRGAGVPAKDIWGKKRRQFLLELLIVFDYICACNSFFFVFLLRSLTILCSSPLTVLHSPGEGEEGWTDPKVKNILLLLLLSPLPQLNICLRGVGCSTDSDTSRWRARWERWGITYRDGRDRTSGMKSHTCFLHRPPFLLLNLSLFTL